MSSGEIEGAAAFPHTISSLFEDAQVALRRLFKVTSLLFVAYELKLRVFSKLSKRLSVLLGLEVTRDTGIYIDKKRSRYYVVRIRLKDGRLLSKYVGKEPGKVISLKKQFQELKYELNRLEEYIDAISDILGSFIDKANWIAETIQSEVGESVGTR